MMMRRRYVISTRTTHKYTRTDTRDGHQTNARMYYNVTSATRPMLPEQIGTGRSEKSNNYVTHQRTTNYTNQLSAG